MKNRFDLKREESIRIILAAALALFSRNGFDKTTIRMIADEAGISLGLLYNYFKSKEDLLKAIFLEGKQYIQESMNGSVKTGNVIEHYIRQTLASLKQHKTFWKLLYAIRLQSPVIELLEEEINPGFELFKHQIENELLLKGIPFPGLESKLFFATIDGIAYHYLLQEKYPVDDVANLLIMKYKG